jgi:hypothetical protein
VLGATIEVVHGAWGRDRFKPVAAGADPRDLPRISDGATLRALDPLMEQDGERTSVSDLDIEHLRTATEELIG